MSRADLRLRLLDMALQRADVATLQNDDKLLDKVRRLEAFVLEHDQPTSGGDKRRGRPPKS